jgi:hypothetical protein
VALALLLHVLALSQGALASQGLKPLAVAAAQLRGCVLAGLCATHALYGVEALALLLSLRDGDPASEKRAAWWRRAASWLRSGRSRLDGAPDVLLAAVELAALCVAALTPRECCCAVWCYATVPRRPPQGCAVEPRVDESRKRVFRRLPYRLSVPLLRPFFYYSGALPMRCR